MIPIHTHSAWRGTSDCRSCAVREVALFSNLNEEDFALIHAPIDDMAYRAHQEKWFQFFEQLAKRDLSP